jgi:hypothetical protein
MDLPGSYSVQWRVPLKQMNSKPDEGLPSFQEIPEALVMDAIFNFFLAILILRGRRSLSEI